MSDSEEVELLCAADYPAEPVEWLWPNRIPIGKVTLLVGDPGNGKSLVALDIAARVSQGEVWPDAKQNPPLPSIGERDREPASVFILSAADDLRDTIRPRLDAAGADPSRVFLLPSIADLRNDINKLHAAVDAVPNCRLIIIDPVNAFVGPSDSHFHTVVRRVFQPLAELAAEKGLAILAVSHLRKHDGAAIQRAAGSMGFVAASRAVWTVCQDPQEAGRYLFLPVKNNFAPSTAGLAYKIEVPESSAELKSQSPAVNWQTEAVATTATDAISTGKKTSGPEAEELYAACDWLREELSFGAVPVMVIQADAMLAGFNDRTLRRALYAIGGKTHKRAYDGGWTWSLPKETEEEPAEEDCAKAKSAHEQYTDEQSAPVETQGEDHPENLSPWEEPVPLREIPTEMQTEEEPPISIWGAWALEPRGYQTPIIRQITIPDKIASPFRSD